MSSKIAEWRTYVLGLVPRRKWLRFLAFLPLAICIYWASLIIIYRFVDPPVSTFMAGQAMTGKKVQYRWVDIERISRHLPAALIMAEDAKYCRHWGVDWSAVGIALNEADRGRKIRGASTIPMQTAKNLFLWPGRSYVRKAIEIPMAYAMSALWPKWRMLEIYMNIVEWGPGIFGAEAAARHHFKKSAARLNPSEAALLAAALPSPYTRRAGRPGPKTRKLARIIRRRMLTAAPWVRCARKSTAALR